VPVSFPDLALALIITGGAAAIQSTAGIGFAIVSVPLLSLLDPLLAPVPQILVALPMVVWMAWRERWAVDLSGVGYILTGRLVGAAIGLVLIKVASDTTLDVLIGVAVLAGVAILARGIRIRQTPVTQVTTGVAASVSSLVASMGGPPLAMLYYDSTGARLRSSLATIFVFGVTLTVVLRAATGEISRTDLEVAAWLLPAAALGLAAGGRFRSRAEGRPIRLAVLGLSAVAAIGLLARAALA
jgi:uncharacterized membrane protein YfcA